MLAVGQYLGKNPQALHDARKLLLRLLRAGYAEHGPTGTFRRGRTHRGSLQPRPARAVHERFDRLPRHVAPRIQRRPRRQSLSDARPRPDRPDHEHPPRRQDGLPRINVFRPVRADRCRYHEPRPGEQIRQTRLQARRRQHHRNPYGQRQDDHGTARRIESASVQPHPSSGRHEGIRPEISHRADRARLRGSRGSRCKSPGRPADPL